MARKRKLSRRSFITRVTGGGVLAGSLASVAGALGPTYTGINDADPTDLVGYGDSPTGTRISDSDNSDARGYGNRGTSGETDADDGNERDPAGAGRGPSQSGNNPNRRPITGVSDADTGSTADPRGRGRGTRCSDQDSGTERDQSGYGDDCGR